MWLSSEEILETLRMFEEQHLDVRTVTMGISLFDCCATDMRSVCERVVRKVLRSAEKLVPTVESVSEEFGIPIVNKRVSISPAAYIAASTGARDYTPLALALDRAAQEIGIDYLGGFSAQVHKGYKDGDRVLIDSLPEALNATQRVCSSISVASTRAGVNMDAVLHMGQVIHRTAHMRPELQGGPCARLVTFCNQPEDNPFIAGAMHGTGEAELSINVGISGPGVVAAAVKQMRGAPLQELAEQIKRTAFKITRMGELVGREVSKRLGCRFGIVDLSLAPTPAAGDSVAEVLEAMGLEKCGTHGTTAALALLNDAVKRGGAMASSSVGGLSGAFIPVSEDAEMARSVSMGALTIDKLEAMTSVCSVGLDMVVVPGDTTAETLSAIMADEMVIGMVNNKTTAVRLLPVPGKRAGDTVDYGGLLGASPILPLHRFQASEFVLRGGRIPSPLQGLTN